MRSTRSALLFCVLLSSAISAGTRAQQPVPPDPTAESRAAVTHSLEIARGFMKEDRYLEALEIAESAVKAWPGHAPAQVVLADALYRKGDFSDAEAGYRRAVEMDPNLAEAHFGVGRILRTLGRYGDAAESFSRAAALAPLVPKYLRTLANHLARREDSLSMLRRYLELVRSDPSHGEEEIIVRNTEAWITLLESLGERPLSEMARAEPCSLPLSVVRGQPYLKISVAGLKNQRFVFDTGATGITVSPRIAARAKLVPIRPFTIVGTGSKRTETGDLVLVPEISLGEGIVLRNVPATVREPLGLEEGLIGPSLFASFDITVDLHRGRLTFDRPGPTRVGRAEAFRNVGGQIMMTSALDGVRLNSMLDTGSTATLIGKSSLGRVPTLRTLPARYTGGATVGIGGMLAEQKALMEGTFSLAGRDYPAGGMPTGDLSGFSRALESEVYVIVGTRHLDDTVFTIDYRRMTVTFSPRSP
ncbi:MAG TPA: tetratricopeptide repeat protein [Candidatus Polarisedimenticolia bacterium]|nr:tetratricopeptide repeat protein [Candidatus Polarisedimenticolia bacterium]